MDNIRNEIIAMETVLRDRGLTVADVLRDAHIRASTWQRWKTTGQVPLTSTWNRVQRAYLHKMLEQLDLLESGKLYSETDE